ncbi:hypothetical protein D3C80_1752140 [compost metagenome]
MAWEFPRVTVFQPIIRRLHLLAIDDVLFEHAIFVADTVTPARQRQRGQRIQEAGSQPTQTAIAQARIVLFLKQFTQVQTHLIECVLNILVNPHR